MSDRMQALAKLLPGKNAIEDYTLEEIEQLTQQYPYFAPAHFLLLQKLKHTHSSQYEQALQKAMLYYHDPLQLEFLLNSEKFYPDLSALPEEEFQERETEVSEENSFSPADASISENAGEMPPIVVEAPFTGDNISEHDFLEEELLAASEEDITPELPPLNISGAGKDEKTATAQQPETPHAADEQPPVEIKEIKNRPASEPLTFEPFHTVDFFASQGIKVDADEKTPDKFGRQVRSFTDWLKVMKKLPASEISKTLDAGTEQKVETMAAQSVGDSDVVTEAMAEVWRKQGNKQKAIETYNKLLLLNPSKKAYFAAQIENLKQS